MSEQVKRIFAGLGVTITQGRCTPLKWDSEKKRLYLFQKDVAKEKYFQGTLKVKNRICLYIQFGIHRIAILTLIAQEIINNRVGQFSRILNWMALLVLTSYNIQLQICNESCEEIVAYVNGLFQFVDRMSGQWTQRKRRFTEQMNLLFGYFMPPTVIIIPVGYVYGLHWLNPHQSSLIGYWILDQWQFDKQIEFFLLKITILLFNHWVWSVAIFAGAFCYGGILALCTIALRDCMHVFWNMEQNFEQTNFPVRARVYRQIQLLATLQTEVQSGTLMTFMIIVPTAMISMTVVLAIRSPWTSENAPIIFISSYYTFLVTIGVVFIIGGQAGVWADSKRMFKKLDRLNLHRLVKSEGFGKRFEWKCQQKFWKSCRNLVKVKFGIGNFVEEETPLNCLSCAASLAVQLLLLDS